MSTNVDLYLDFNEDLVLTPAGSIRTATGWDNVRERIIRNLITNSGITLSDGSSTPPDYIWDPEYGLGLGTHVDANMTEDEIANIEQSIRQAIYSDPNIDPGTPPTIIFKRANSNIMQIFISVRLIQAVTGINAPVGSLQLSMG